MLTDNQLARLTAYEQYFATALRSNYPRSPGPRALREIHAVLCEVDPTTPVLNTTCGTCILRVLKKAGRLYFDRKEADAKNDAEAVEKTIEEGPEQVGTKTAAPENTPQKPQISTQKPKTGKATAKTNKGRKSAKK